MKHFDWTSILRDRSVGSSWKTYLLESHFRRLDTLFTN